MINIRFKTLKLQYFVAFACSVILTGGVISYYLMTGLEGALRRYLWIFYNQWIAGLVVAGIVSVPLYSLAFMILKLFTKEHELYVKQQNVELKAKNFNKAIFYHEIENIIIHNTGNYAKLTIETDTTKYKFNTGPGNLSLAFWKINFQNI